MNPPTKGPTSGLSVHRELAIYLITLDSYKLRRFQCKIHVAQPGGSPLQLCIEWPSSIDHVGGVALQGEEVGLPYERTSLEENISPQPP
jgi:hypothetical protein